VIRGSIERIMKPLLSRGRLTNLKSAFVTHVMIPTVGHGWVGPVKVSGLGICISESIHLGRLGSVRHLRRASC